VTLANLASGAYPPNKVSATFSLLTSTAIRTLRNLHNSISLNRQILKHPVITLSNNLVTGYAYFSTFFHRASTFKLLATECYRHWYPSSHIPFNSPYRAHSNPSCPGPDRGLVLKLSPLLYLYSPDLLL